MYKLGRAESGNCWQERTEGEGPPTTSWSGGEGPRRIEDVGKCYWGGNCESKRVSRKNVGYTQDDVEGGRSGKR